MRMPMAGTSSMYSHGCHTKKRARDASSDWKKPPIMKVKKPVRIKKIIRKTYAIGDPK